MRIESVVKKMTAKIFDKMKKAEKARSAIKYHCPYGVTYFCDGKVNRTEMKERVMTGKEPCGYLKDDECTNPKCAVV